MANVNNIEGMLGSMDLSKVEQKAVTLNVSKRLPAIMLVDTSGSMGSYEDLLKRSVEGLYEAILADRTASNSTELAVLTFNSDIEILERMREIKAQEAQGKNLDFHCHGCTLTGLALKNAIMQIEGRKKVYAKVVPKIKYYAPIIFLISDGVPECYDENVKPQEAEAMAFSKAYIKREAAANRLVVISVEVSDHCDHALMKELTGLNNDKHVTKVSNASELANFFKVTSSIIISSSKRGTKDLNNIPFADMK
mgnify:FL=1